MSDGSDDPFMHGLLARCEFPPAGTSVTCAVSGGADSMSLLVLACAAGLDVTAVHVDHGLRPGSELEADVVRSAAARFGASFRSARVELEPGPNQEARARAARWAVLGSGALTGHTADDQAETMLVNLLRGSGLTGLGGMRPGGSHPLLMLRRSETRRLCSDLRIVVIDDPTNTDPRFVRNRIRHELLPLLDSISGRDIVPVLTRAAGRLRSIDDGLNELAASLDPTDARQLRASPPVLAAVALRRWLTDAEGHPPSEAELQRVLAVVRNEAIGCELSGGRSVKRTNGVLRLVEPR